MKRTFFEDRDMIEAQQKLVDSDTSGVREIDIAGDAGPALMRRMIDRMVTREAQEATAPVT